MKSKNIRLAILSWVLLGGFFWTVTLHAQTSTQGAIIGTSLDVTGAAVPNAIVRIVNTATNATIELHSNDTGGFNAPLLEPGVYTVTVTAPGFEAYVVNQVIVQVGQATNIESKLTAGASSTTVAVTAEAPVINSSSPQFSSNINTKALENIPMNNRRWSALAMTTPGVVGDASGLGLISVRGISTILNNVMIDGADDNQAFFSEERGRTREAYSTSGAAVREFQVNAGVYPAEFGRSAGGVINSVTKSGTNQLHGQAYFSDRESNWNAMQAQTTLTKIVNGANVTTPYKPEDLRKIYGFTAGGALIKDKLFWIYTYDQHTHIFPMMGVPNNPSLFYQQPDVLGSVGDTACKSNGYLATTTAGVTSAHATLDQQICTLAARLSKSAQTTYGSQVTYSDAASVYSAGLSAINSDMGLIPRKGYQEINTPKVDWTINSKNSVSFLYHRLRWDSPGGVQSTPTGAYSFDSAGNDFVKLDYGVTKLISLITSNLSNELLYQYSRELDDETLQKITAYDTNNLVASTNGGVNGSGPNDPYVQLYTTAGMYIGAPYYSFRPAYPDERKWQVGDNLFYVHGRHTIKFGVDLVHNYDIENQKQYYEGKFTYSNNIANYFADLYSKGAGAGTCNSSLTSAATSATAVVTGSYPCYNSFLQDYGPSSFDLSTMDSGVFAQDNWKVNSRLTLQLGLRYDYEHVPEPFAATTVATGSYVPFNGLTNHPSDKTGYQPRFGFAYDVFGNSKTVVRGGYGIYVGRITNGNIGTLLSTTGSPLSQGASTVKPANGLASEPIFPYTFTSAMVGSAGSVKPSAYFFDSNLKTPKVQEFDLILQQELFKGNVLGISYLGGLGRHLPNFLDVNLNPSSLTNVSYTVVDNSANGSSPLSAGTVVTIPTYTAYGNTNLLGPAAANFTTITEYTSNINSSYNAMVVELQNRSIHNLQFDFNYTWAHSLDYSQNASTAGNTNNWYDPYQNPRINYGNSTWDIKNRAVAYVIYDLPNLHVNRKLRYLLNDWKVDDSIYIQTGMPFSMAVSGSPSNAIAGDLNGAGGATFLPQLGFNNHFQRRTEVDDMRVEKDIRYAERYRLELMAQVFNVANHQNVTSVTSTAFNAETQSNNVGNTLNYDYNGNVWGQVTKTNNSGFSFAPRQVEISAKLFF